MKKILFIEDEEALQKTLSEVLTQEDFKVISSLDGETGLELAKKEKPDLVLLDLILPKMNGFDVLASLKSCEETKEIPVVVMTNLENLENVERAIEAGATTYLCKAQYSLTEILEKIKRILE
ncbi:MAG: response regulator [Candidatus Paceibacterota bacterium]|jgi:DNA-binding response OmpR family regulator|nr:response regulator [Candidatus Paceibacterota bacterium]MDD4831083.1 response regulator [Candidatus Paceibacterota bacterium]MDD4875033.1 response regulator [Candidatus Paceibacterota bacterium]